MERTKQWTRLSVAFACVLLVGCSVSQPTRPTQVEMQVSADGERVAAATAVINSTLSITPSIVDDDPGLEAVVDVPSSKEAPGSKKSIQPEEQLARVDTKTLADPEVTVTPDLRKEPKYWPEWPLVPTVSSRAVEIYILGQQLGNNPRAFTTIGDCQSEPPVFLGIYDTDHYVLGEGYGYLEETIEHFKGSFARQNVTVKDGLSIASVLSPAWADPDRCESGETPLACEIRLQRPVIAFINLGTNWQGGDDVKHESYMRKVVDILIKNGIVPVISTKGDNLEGDHRINRSMARVAYDYDLPLWNFWRSIRDLPGKGIDGSRPGGYLTTAAWGRRTFNGLLALDAVWRGVTGQPLP